MKKAISKTKVRLATLLMVAISFISTAHAASPGITGPTFNLRAEAAYISQPDGALIYSWGYGCEGAPTAFAPSAISNAFCSTMQIPGPTLIVTQGQTVTVTLTNHLPTAAGNTSILFPGFDVTTSGGVAGLLTAEAATGGTVVYDKDGSMLVLKDGVLYRPKQVTTWALEPMT